MILSWKNQNGHSAGRNSQAMRKDNQYKPEEKLALIAGRGALPDHIIEARHAEGRDVVIVVIEGQTSDDYLAKDADMIHCRFGEVETLISALRERRITQVVMAGQMQRPSLRDIRPDAMGRKLLMKLGGGLFAGDDALLSRITTFLEEQGFRVVGPDAICGSLLTPTGCLTETKPDAQSQEDAQFAARLLRDLSRYDIGQAVMVHQSQVLGIEAVEGTTALIARCGQYQTEHGGILVKTPKQGQERRVDLPAAGVETIRQLAAGGFHGLYLGANETLMLGREAMVAAADHHGLFIVGMQREQREADV